MNDLLAHPWFRVLLIATTVAMCCLALREAGPLLSPIITAVGEVLLPAAIGFVIAYVLTPLVDLISRRVGTTRFLATGAIFGLACGILVTSVVLVAPPVVRQATALGQQTMVGEAYTDVNQDGAWQPGEAFSDVNRNGLRDGPLLANAVAWVDLKQASLHRLTGAMPTDEGLVMADFAVKTVAAQIDSSSAAQHAAQATVTGVLRAHRGLTVVGTVDAAAWERLRHDINTGLATSGTAAGLTAIQELAVKEKQGDGFANEVLDLLPRQDSAASRSVSSWINAVERGLGDWLGSLPEHLARAGGDASGGLQRMMGLVIDTILVPIYAFFMILAMPAIREWARSAIPHRHRPQVLAMIRDIERAVAAFFRGRLIICGLCGLTGVIGFLVAGWVGVGTPYGVLFGLGIGLATIIPLAGILLLIPALILTWLQPGAGPMDLVLVCVVYGLIQAVEAILIPVIMGRDIELHPITLIIALLLCGKLFGVLGLILAVPIAATVRILARTYLWPRLHRWTEQGMDVVQPPANPPG